MKEYPILFSPTMVKAVLDGRKTQTRRIIKEPEKTEKCPYGMPGCILWVRETWTETDDEYGTPIVVYKADMSQQVIGRDKNGYHLCGTQQTKFEVHKWKPSIFMPKWASRLKLDITGIRTERLNEISENDAEAEGIESWYEETFFKDYSTETGWTRDPVASFQTLWDLINRKNGFGWDTNPFVWVVEFKPLNTNGNITRH